MKIYINDTDIEIFNGARIRNALMKYSKKEFQEILKGKKQVIDSRKNQLDLDGELSATQYLYIVDVNQEK